MLSFLINANAADDKLMEHHAELIKKVSQMEANFEVIFLARENFPQLNLLKITASQVPNHNLAICAKGSSDSELTEIGLKIADSNDVLICTLDTSPDTVCRMLEKRKEGKKIVYVRRKSNKFVQFFRALGNLTYNAGLAMMGKSRDNFSEVSVQYLDGRVVNSLNMNPGKTRELRISNTYKQLDTAVVEEGQIYREEQKKKFKERVMYSTGWVAAIYLLAFLAMAIIYPFFNNFVYSWWIAVALVVWILLGIAFTVYFSKILFKQRSGQPLALDRDGQPVLRIVDIVEFGDKITLPMDLKAIASPMIKSGKVKVVKPKKRQPAADKSSQPNTAGDNFRKAVLKGTLAAKEKNTKPPKKDKAKTAGAVKKIASPKSTEQKAESEPAKARGEKTAPKTTAKIAQKTNKNTQKTKQSLSKTEKTSKGIAKSAKTSQPTAKSDESKIASKAKTSKPAPAKTKAKTTKEKAKN